MSFLGSLFGLRGKDNSAEAPALPFAPVPTEAPLPQAPITPDTPGSYHTERSHVAASQQSSTSATTPTSLPDQSRTKSSLSNDDIAVATSKKDNNVCRNTDSTAPTPASTSISNAVAVSGSDTSWNSEAEVNLGTSVNTDAKSGGTTATTSQSALATPNGSNVASIVPTEAPPLSTPMSTSAHSNTTKVASIPTPRRKDNNSERNSTMSVNANTNTSKGGANIKPTKGKKEKKEKLGGTSSGVTLTQAKPANGSSTRGQSHSNNSYTKSGSHTHTSDSSAGRYSIPPSAAVQPMQHHIYETAGRRTRILMVTHVHGRLSYLNNLIQATKPTAVINAGNFGFFDDDSYIRMRASDIESRLQSSMVYPLTPAETSRALSMTNTTQLRAFLRQRRVFSELPAFLNNEMSFRVPVYTVWGVDEDIRVIEKFRSKEYQVGNLHLLDETQAFNIRHTDIQLIGLGGNLVYHWLFDNGQGQERVSGDVGKLWVTLLQLASLIKMADKMYDPVAIRVLVTHVSAGREPVIAQLAHRVKADYSVSGHFHSRYCVSLNAWAVSDYETFVKRLEQSKSDIMTCWKGIEAHAEQQCQPEELEQIRFALTLMDEMPTVDDFRSLWHVSLPDIDSGHAFLGLGAGDKYTLETYSEGRDHARLKHVNNTEGKRKERTKNKPARSSKGGRRESEIDHRTVQ
eukprot:CFRG5276T1